MSTQPPEADISTLLSRLIGCALPKQLRPRNSRSTDSLKFETLESRLVMSGNLELNGGIEEDNNTGHPQLCGCGCCGAGYFNELNTLELNSTSDESGDGEQFPLESLPLLSSNSNASVKLYLDFDGHFESNWGSYSNITTPAFSLDGDFSSFNTAEINSITEIWQRVSEDYAPFNIDVTTIDPGDFSNGNALRVAIGGSSSWYSSGAGGVAYVNTFTNSIVNTVYVFPDNLAKNAKYIAEASSHEAGHGFGLRHQSTYDNGTKTNEYNPGSGDWAPIMGVSYYKARTTWHDGTTTSANTYQDDMAVIARATNGFGYRTDDHGNINSATTLSFAGNNATASGIIERMSDEDAFSFSTTGGQVDLSVNVAEVGANLDSVIELRTASGQLIATADPSGSYGAVISTDVAAGDYVLVVRSTGEYGSVGQYTVSATRSESTATNEISIAGNTSVAAGGLYTLNLSEANAQSSTISRWSINWGDGNIQTINGNPNTVTHIYAEGPNAFSITATATDAAGTYQSNTLTVDVFDPAPELAISGSSIVTEGSTYVLGLSADGSGAATITQWTINWGDGTIQTINGNPNSASHVYADGTAAFTIQATATNAAGTFSANALAVTVNNVDATLNISGNSSVGEGNTYTLSLADTDPGADTINSWTINWGDGTIQTINGDPTYATHVYAGSGQYAISATASDEDGSYQSNAVAVNVLEAAPQLSISGTGSTAEGSSYNLTLNADGSGADTITQWTINWGDGTIQTINGNPNSASHVYADGTAAYTIQATATNAAGTFSANNLAVTVNNVAATLNISGNNSVGEGNTYTLSLADTDPGADTITSWTINWGDGTIQTINGDPTYATHVYAGSGQYAISATASDEDGSYQSNAVAVNVLEAAPQLSISGTGSTAEGSSYNLTLNADGSGADTITQWTINWGDGTIETVNGNPNSASHVYADGTAAFTIQATATNGAGTFSANNLGVTVNNVAATLNISGDSSVDEGETYTLDLSSTDPGADTITSWTINWGDGTIETINGDPSSATHVYTGGGQYAISATASDEDGSYQSNAVAVNVLAGQNIASPSNLVITGKSGAQLQVQWQDNSTGETAFVIERVTTTSSVRYTSEWVTVGTTGANTTSFTDTVPSAGRYLYRVRAVADVDGDGQSDLFSGYSNEVYVKFKPGEVQQEVPQLNISGAGNTAEGSSYNLTLNADGSGADTIQNWTINWGDGTVETINGNPNSASHVYADGTAAYTIQATATNATGTFSANTLAVTVNNVDATLNIAGNSSIDEGETYTLNLSSTDPGADTITSWTINWGDGTVQTINGDPTYATHVYAGSGQYAISATASDEDGSYQSNAVAVNVHEVAPQLSISGSGNTAEGSTYNLTLNADGSGADTITQWTINWGDGTIETINGNPNSASHVYVDGSAAFTIQATATNGAGTVSANNLAVTVNNVAADLNISGFSAVGEGETYTLNLSSTDPGADTISSWTINWGDGTIQTINGDPSTVTHVYGAGGQFTISATASDEDGTYQSNSFGLSVIGAAPQLSISGSGSTAEGSTYNLTLNADGSGADTITQWTINWGDGTIETINGNPNSASHVYADGSAAFTIQATATNAAGTFSANALAVTVNNVDATLNISGDSSIGEGENYTLDLSSTDPGADTITGWTINWGDGTIQTINGDPSSATHVYNGGGQYTISATASDEDGSYQSNAVAVSVLAGQNIASPSNLVITGKSGAQLQVQWQDNSTGETAFVIERVTTSYSVRYTSEWVTVGTTGPNATSFTDTVPSDGRYLYRVRAVADVDGDGQFDLFSGYSNEVYVKFKPGEVQQTSNNVAAFQSDVTPPSWEHWAMAAESSTNHQPLFSASQADEIDPRELFFAEYGKQVH